MAGALKARVGGAWTYVKGVKGDKGDPGPPSVGLTTLTSDYDQTIRQVNVAGSPQLLFRNSDTLFLNDHDSAIDPTGVNECSAPIQAVLTAAVSRGVKRVWSESGSVYKVASAIDVPAQVIWTGGEGVGNTATLKWYGAPAALDNTSHMVRLAGDFAGVRGLTFDLRNVANSVAVRPKDGMQQTIEDCAFSNTAASSVSIRGGSLLYFHIRRCRFTPSSGRHIHLINANADTPTYYGVNVGTMRDCVFGGYLDKPWVQVEGIFNLYDNDFEPNVRVTNSVVIAGGAVQSFLLLQGNYFEITNSGGAVPYAVQGVGSSKLGLIANRIYGPSSTLVGSRAISASSDQFVSHLNEFTNWETPIVLSQSGSASHSIGPDYLNNVANDYNISGGSGITISPLTGVSYHSSNSPAPTATTRFAITEHLVTAKTSLAGAITLAAGTGAGTSPTVSIAGTDLAGTITVTTGTAPAASATVATATFHVAYGSIPTSVVLTPASGSSAALSGAGMVYEDQASRSATAFALNVGSTPLAASTTYKWSYQVIG